MEAIASRKASQWAVGLQIRAKDAVVSPDFSEISFGNWTGVIVELYRNKSGIKYFVEWDDSTVARMPAEYMHSCEEGQLYYRMACLGQDEIEPTESRS